MPPRLTKKGLPDKRSITSKANMDKARDAFLDFVALGKKAAKTREFTDDNVTLPEEPEEPEEPEDENEYIEVEVEEDDVEELEEEIKKVSLKKKKPKKKPEPEPEEEEEEEEEPEPVKKVPKKKAPPKKTKPIDIPAPVKKSIYDIF